MTEPTTPALLPKTARTTLKLLIILGLIIVLFIPLQLIQGLVDERQERAASVQTELTRELGGAVALIGPLLVIPGEAGAVGFVAPKQLTAKSQVQVEPRYRSIFATQAYTVTTTLEGSFELEAGVLATQLAGPQWQSAQLSVLWLDPSREALGMTAQLGPTTLTEFVSNSFDSQYGGRSGRVDVSALGSGGRLSFRITLKHRGVEALQLGATGADTRLEMSANWPDPSFQSPNLPLTRTITDSGFTATWIAQRSQNLVEVVRGAGLPTFVTRAGWLGVNFVESVSHYQHVTRAVKYALFIILLAFTAFFLFEVTGGLQIHPMQYLFAGAALVVFYLLLLSLSEHVGFVPAYAIASVAVVLLLSLYARVMLRGEKRALGFGAGVAVQYGLLFVILRAEDYALLTGAVTLFMLLALVMYLTRRVNWYGNA